MKRKYHGWIYKQPSDVFKDHFSIHVTREGKEPFCPAMGYGERGAAAAVQYFEEAEVTVYQDRDSVPVKFAGLALGHVKLEQTPLGLRVYTEQEE